MRTRLLASVLLIAFAGCSDEKEQVVLLPDDPCSLVSRADVAAAVKAEVTNVERVPSIDQIVAAQKTGGDAVDVPRRDQRLCSYTTTSGFGALVVFVPARSDDGAELFASKRDNAKEVDEVGDDAYFTGGALSVLVDGQMFSVQVQMAGREGVQPALTSLAKRAVERLTSRDVLRYLSPSA